MESIAFLEGCAPPPAVLEGIAQDSSYFFADETSYKSSIRPLRPHSRKHRTNHLTHRSAALNESITSTQPYTRLRLRRTQAFSDLLNSTSPTFAPTVSVAVAKYCWLEESVAKAKSILVDKEQAEQISHQVRAVPSIEYLDAIPAEDTESGQQAIQLHHKNKSHDLRSKYASDDAKAYYGPPVASMSSSSDEKLSPDSAENYATSCTNTISSDSDCSIRAQLDAYCICHRTFDVLLDDMVACGLCGDCIHVGCVGKECGSSKDFDEAVFYCSDCEVLDFGTTMEEDEVSYSAISRLQGSAMRNGVYQDLGEI